MHPDPKRTPPIPAIDLAKNSRRFISIAVRSLNNYAAMSLNNYATTVIPAEGLVEKVEIASSLRSSQ
jgi:hypothetical protein